MRISLVSVLYEKVSVAKEAIECDVKFGASSKEIFVFSVMKVFTRIISIWLESSVSFARMITNMA